MNTIRVAIVDDHPIVRQGLKSLLSQFEEIDITGEGYDRASAIQLILEKKPDVVLLDIRLKHQSGLDIAQQLKRLNSPSKIIILTSYEDSSYILKAAEMGVSGYLLKSASPEMLISAIKAVHAGEKRLSPEIGGKAIEQLGLLSQKYNPVEIGMTQQEIQLLELLAAGASTQDITDAMYLSESTIKRKIQDILNKLGANNRAQAVAEAFKRGLL